MASSTTRTVDLTLADLYCVPLALNLGLPESVGEAWRDEMRATALHGPRLGPGRREKRRADRGRRCLEMLDGRPAGPVRRGGV